MKFPEILRARRKELGLTQQDIADIWGIKSVNVSDWERGKGMPETARLGALAKRLGMTISELMGEATPRLDVKDRTDGLHGASKVNAIHPDDPMDDDVVYVPESRIEFAAGNGRNAVYELIEDQEPASYRLSWFQKYGINPERVRRFRVSGESMEPMLFDRDTILVNTDEVNIIDGKMYAIRYGDELRVKYLFRKLDGTLTLRSVNPLFKDEEVPPQLANDHISIIGRVRDRSGTGGL
ncbi:Phage repressor protein C, contains Cro/C1-type HTH and peptisase s24 domains [Janthinobacterium sp. TND4EL3]|jgi:phage repressor protein C with HTH and peptisase S24 domain|uniref:XRE family transcriptional regulator n=1 Tax=Janthinobacterium sp. TND4EL3 TaxID=1907311 RepID=UPI000953D6BA|nr:LexA family transcriptional regulator [Janthinobacterium sp. TND4EL3]SIQ21382.1 Phage repressor protein C, contains Cro/C1-type HTH and peptisase s24 domains [Janthinobacterium sp. TND4EL3]